MSPEEKRAREINWLIFMLKGNLARTKTKKVKALLKSVVPKRKRFIIAKIEALTENLIDIIKENR